MKAKLLFCMFRRKFAEKAEIFRENVKCVTLHLNFRINASITTTGGKEDKVLHENLESSLNQQNLS